MVLLTMPGQRAHFQILILFKEKWNKDRSSLRDHLTPTLISKRLREMLIKSTMRPINLEGTLERKNLQLMITNLNLVLLPSSSLLTSQMLSCLTLTDLYRIFLKLRLERLVMRSTKLSSRGLMNGRRKTQMVTLPFLRVQTSKEFLDSFRLKKRKRQLTVCSCRRLEDSQTTSIPCSTRSWTRVKVSFMDTMMSIRQQSTLNKHERIFWILIKWNVTNWKRNTPIIINLWTAQENILI